MTRPSQTIVVFIAALVAIVLIPQLVHAQPTATDLDSCSNMIGSSPDILQELTVQQFTDACNACASTFDRSSDLLTMVEFEAERHGGMWPLASFDPAQMNEDRITTMYCTSLVLAGDSCLTTNDAATCEQLTPILQQNTERCINTAQQVQQTFTSSYDLNCFGGTPPPGFNCVEEIEQLIDYGAAGCINAVLSVPQDRCAVETGQSYLTCNQRGLDTTLGPAEAALADAPTPVPPTIDDPDVALCVSNSNISLEDLGYEEVQDFCSQCISTNYVDFDDHTNTLYTSTYTYTGSRHAANLCGQDAFHFQRCLETHGTSELDKCAALAASISNRRSSCVDAMPIVTYTSTDCETTGGITTCAEVPDPPDGTERSNFIFETCQANSDEIFSGCLDDIPSQSSTAVAACVNDFETSTTVDDFVSVDPDNDGTVENPLAACTDIKRLNLSPSEYTRSGVNRYTSAAGVTSGNLYDELLSSCSSCLANQYSTISIPGFTYVQIDEEPEEPECIPSIHFVRQCMDSDVIFPDPSDRTWSACNTIMHELERPSPGCILPPVIDSSARSVTREEQTREFACETATSLIYECIASDKIFTDENLRTLENCSEAIRSLEYADAGCYSQYGQDGVAVARDECARILGEVIDMCRDSDDLSVCVEAEYIARDITPRDLGNALLTCSFQDDALACRNCLNAGGTWTSIGCFNTSSTDGIVGSMIRITLGVLGGVFLVMLIITGYAYQEAIKDGNAETSTKMMARLKIMAGTLVFLAFSGLLLRIIGVNILDVTTSGILGRSS